MGNSARRRLFAAVALILTSALFNTTACTASQGNPPPSRSPGSGQPANPTAPASRSTPEACPEEWLGLEPFTVEVADNLTGTDVLECSNTTNWTPALRRFYGWERVWAEDGVELPAPVEMGLGEAASWEAVECRPLEGVTLWWANEQWLRGRQVECDYRDVSAPR
jgi:hypothetical protein